MGKAARFCLLLGSPTPHTHAILGLKSCVYSTLRASEAQSGVFHTLCTAWYTECMIHVEGHEFFRGGEKIGYLMDGWIHSHDGRKLGYVEGHSVYDHNGRKVAWLDGNHIYLTDHNEHWSIDENHRHVEGGDLPDTLRAAARIFLGD